MPEQCTLYVKDTPYEATVTDVDALFFMTLLLDNMDEIITQEEGIIESFDRLAAEQKERLAQEQKTQDKEGASEVVIKNMGERVILRVNHNITIRHQLCERLCEIAPDLESAGIVTYSSRTHTDHSREIKAKMRIDMTDLITGVFAPVIQSFNQADLKAARDAAEIRLERDQGEAPTDDVWADDTSTLDVEATAVDTPQLPESNAQPVPAAMKTAKPEPAPAAKSKARSKKTTTKKTPARKGGKAPAKPPTNGKREVTEEELEALVQERLAQKA